MNLRTGYFANTKRGGKVHVVRNDVGSPPICGSKIGEDMQFQHCANGIHLDYVECKKCKKNANKF